MKFQWDPGKAITNKQRHKISFELAKFVFDAPLHLTDSEGVVQGEERFTTLGQVGDVVLFVVHTYREGKDAKEEIRIISARKATEREKSAYHRRLGG